MQIGTQNLEHLSSKSLKKNVASHIDDIMTSNVEPA